MFGKKTYKAQNTRRYKRLRAGYLVKYQVAGSEQEPVVTNLKDLSAGGVKFWSEKYVAEGALMKVGLLVPALDRVVEALGRAVRVRQTKDQTLYYVAVSFIELSHEAKEGIDAFVEYLSQLPDTRALVSGSDLVNRTILV